MILTNSVIRKLLLVIRRFLKWILWFVGAIVLLGLIIFLISKYEGFEYNKFRQEQPFNSALWQKVFLDNDGKKIDVHELRRQKIFDRCYMYRNLIKDHLRFGMLYGDLVKLLGEPGYVSYYSNPELKEIPYGLGYCLKDTLNIETGPEEFCYLVLYFNRNSELVAFGRSYGKMWYNKNLSFKNKKYLFSCSSRYIEVGSCERYTEEIGKDGSIRGHSFEHCQKSEVESKWGYEMW